MTPTFAATYQQVLLSMSIPFIPVFRSIDVDNRQSEGEGAVVYHSLTASQRRMEDATLQASQDQKGDMKVHVALVSLHAKICMMQQKGG